MSWSEDSKGQGTAMFGSDVEGKTLVFGDLGGSVERVFINGDGQFATRDFSSALHRFGNINGIRNRDYLHAVNEIFG